ncbi:zinc finger, C2H2-type domain-containing protein [Elysia marginata]|uniref:Zinc finger, C2H2-type domain-containing protein n=1 Tax=Elysia marginata TaxID=1093978 RepID=A0AAV4JGS5_9GAST|nr:zinc finger, C2H2-type domain-containing protein [Elysia marginata]
MIAVVVVVVVILLLVVVVIVVVLVVVVMMMIVVVVVVVVFVCLVGLSHPEKVCPRDKSRVVSRVVREKMFPAFNELGVQLNPSCSFSLERDIYAIQEDHKVEESSTRWTCNFCGKSFVSEFYLDRHLENRHKDSIQTGDVVCLADVCDVFRCDIISGATQPEFWDVALCLESDMQELASQCQTLINGCIPTGLSKNETETLKGQMESSVCNFLTCSRYWDRPTQEDLNPHLALYAVLTTMTIFGIIIYNFVFYNYFFSDLGDSYDPTPRHKYRMKNYQKRPASADTNKVSRHRGHTMDGPPR